MNFCPLGPSGLHVSRIALGSLPFLWTADEDESFAVLDAFVESGGTFIDTANVYTRQGAGVGTVESLIGRWLSKRNCRDEIVVATKVGARMWDGANGGGLGRKHIVQALEGSLNRLQTDFVDLYQPHWPDVAVPIDETMRALDDLVSSGKVLYLGASNFSNPWRLAEAQLLALSRGTTPFVSYQGHYSALYREEFERWLQPVVDRFSLGFMAWSVLEGGLLTAKHVPGQGIVSRRLGEPRSDPAVLEPVLAFQRVAEHAGYTPAQLACAWVLNRHPRSVAIVGASRPEQLKDAFDAVDARLDPSVVDAVNAVAPWTAPVWWPAGL